MLALVQVRALRLTLELRHELLMPEFHRARALRPVTAIQKILMVNGGQGFGVDYHFGVCGSRLAYMVLQRTPVPPPWEEALNSWIELLKVQAKAERTIQTRACHVRQFARESKVIDPADVTSDILVKWAGNKEWKPETRHTYYTSLRMFFRYFCQLQGLGNSPAEILCTVKRPVPPPRPIPDELFAQALKAARTIEEELILELAGYAGLRCVEIAQIHGDDLLHDLQWEYALKVRGKGGKYRIVPLARELYRKIERHLESSYNGFLFPGSDHGHWSALWVSKQGKDLLPANWTMHTLRHRFGTAVYWHSGNDILLTRDLLGHASVETTMRYAAIDPDGKKDVIAKIQLNPNDLA